MTDYYNNIPLTERVEVDVGEIDELDISTIRVSNLYIDGYKSSNQISTQKLIIDNKEIDEVETSLNNNYATNNKKIYSGGLIDEKLESIINYYIVNEITTMDATKNTNNYLYLSSENTTVEINEISFTFEQYKVYKCINDNNTIDYVEQSPIKDNTIITVLENNKHYYYSNNSFKILDVGQPYGSVLSSSSTSEIFNDYTNNKASGNYAHAEGNNTNASGNYSHAEGYYTTASSNYSHAEGGHTIASGDNSHAEGFYTKADQINQTAIGKYNTTSKTNSFLSDGNGTADNARSDAFVVKSTGEVIINSIATETKPKLIIGDISSSAVGQELILGTSKEITGTTATNSSTENDDKIITTKYYVDDNNIGKKYYVSGVAKGEIFNSLLSNIASGEFSHAEGRQTKATSGEAHAEGFYTRASGSCAHAEGLDTIASGEYSHAEGRQTTASGNYSHAEGYYSTASSYYSHAEGYYATASGNFSHAGGQRTTADQVNQTAIGIYNTSSNTNSLLSIGNGTADNARSDAFVVKSTGEVIINSTATGTTPKLTINDYLPIEGTTASNTSLNSDDKYLATKFYVDSIIDALNINYQKFMFYGIGTVYYSLLPIFDGGGYGTREYHTLNTYMQVNYDYNNNNPNCFIKIPKFMLDLGTTNYYYISIMNVKIENLGHRYRFAKVWTSTYRNNLSCGVFSGVYRNLNNENYYVSGTLGIDIMQPNIPSDAPAQYYDNIIDLNFNDSLATLDYDTAEFGITDYVVSPINQSQKILDKKEINNYIDLSIEFIPDTFTITEIN